MKVFIAGAIKITTLEPEVIKKLDNIIEKNFEVLLGDASGIDSLVQGYIAKRKYMNVKIYATNGQVRNNIGRWEVCSVMSERKTRDRAYFTVKDEKMAEDSDIGFMIWNGESQGTLNNMINLLSENKRVCLYMAGEKRTIILKSISDLEKVIEKLDEAVKRMYNKILQVKIKKNEKKSVSRVLETTQIRLAI